jgi:hypothetical protein
VRLRVFDTEFHVHSSALKLSSAFSRKFLDSPSKLQASSSTFFYEWITKVDEDGSWALVSGDTAEVRGWIDPWYRDLIAKRNVEQVGEHQRPSIHERSRFGSAELQNIPLCHSWTTIFSFQYC